MSNGGIKLKPHHCWGLTAVPPEALEVNSGELWEGQIWTLGSVTIEVPDAVSMLAAQAIAHAWTCCDPTCDEWTAAEYWAWMGEAIAQFLSPETQKTAEIVIPQQ